MDINRLKITTGCIFFIFCVFIQVSFADKEVSLATRIHSVEREIYYKKFKKAENILLKKQLAQRFDLDHITII